MSHKHTEPPTAQETSLFFSPRLRVKAAYLTLQEQTKIRGENRKRKRVKRNENTHKKNFFKGERMRSTENRESLLGGGL